MNYTVYEIDLPLSVKGCVIPEHDDTYTIYINQGLSDQEKQKALSHELNHLKRDDLYSRDSVERIENANSKKDSIR